MIYETSLKRLQAKRTADKHGVKPVTALEVQPLSYIKHLEAISLTKGLTAACDCYFCSLL